MAIVVEDGTGKIDAVSYVSVADTDAYHLARGNAAWAAASDASKEAALVRATSALDGMYSGRWPGRRYDQDQALDWPRSDAWDRDSYPLTGVPQRIKDATSAAALVELAEAGALSKSQERGGAVRREKIGPIETEYAPGAPAVTAYPAITQALARIVRGSGGLTITRV